jgi:hypothetical protein
LLTCDHVATFSLLRGGNNQFTHIYWFSSNLFSLCQLGLFKVPFIKKALGLPDYQGVSPMLASSDPQPTKPEATFQQKPRIIRTKSQK